MESTKLHDTSSNGGTSNTSISNNNNSSSHRETKRQQFNSKQRMDMYAFCVLELEMHSNKVSIKKQQQAIQKVLYEQQQQQQQRGCLGIQQLQQHHQPMDSIDQQPNPPCLPAQPLDSVQLDLQQPHQSQIQSQPFEQSLNQPDQVPSTSSSQQQQLVVIQSQHMNNHQSVLSNGNGEQSSLHNDSNASSNQSGVEGKTLLQLQQEVAMTRRCYSDYQRTQVLTSSMLREVQKRFAKYYPDSAIPSRTTVKHVFEKCVAHGTVENMRTPRKATKLPQGDKIEYLLIHEPQLSLRQLAQRLNVSTGTISRRCKALGLMPESVTIKHQQLASARRQKQIKQLESQSKMQAIEPATNGNGPQVDGPINR